MKKLLSIMVLALLLTLGYGQPGSKLPTINRADANKETKKLPTIQPPAQPKSATHTNNNTETVGNKNNKTSNEDVSLNNLIKDYVYDIMETNGVSLSCSFYGGTRYAIGMRTESGGMAVLTALPDLFDNKYEYASDCYTLIREITAKKADGQMWEVEKSEYAREFAPGFIYIPASDITDRSYDIVVPEREHFSGYMVWVFKGKNDNPDYYVTNEEVNFGGKSSTAVRQPSVNAIAGILLDDSPNVSLCAVAKKVNGKWELMKVTASSDQIEAEAQKALPKPIVDSRGEQTREESSRVETPRTEQSAAEPANGKTAKSDSPKSGKGKAEKQKTGKSNKDARQGETRGGNDRGSEVDAPSERGSDVSVPNERELDSTSPRDSGRGGGDDSEGRK